MTIFSEILKNLIVLINFITVVGRKRSACVVSKNGEPPDFLKILNRTFSSHCIKDLSLILDSKGFDLPLTVKMPPWEDGLKMQCLSTKWLQTY